MIEDEVEQPCISNMSAAELDSLMLQASQKYEVEQPCTSDMSLDASGITRLKCKETTLRFAPALCSKQLMNKVNEAVPANTQSNTKWGGLTWKDWQ